jgi:hypothetical protein
MTRKNAPHRCAAVRCLFTVATPVLAPVLTPVLAPLGWTSVLLAGGLSQPPTQVVRAVIPFVDTDSTLATWGRTVVLDQDRVLVAHGCNPIPAPNASCSFTGGGAEIWSRDAGDLWRREAHLGLPLGVAGTAHFGKAIALRGDVAIIGSPMAKTAGVTGSGQVFVYRRSADGSWPLVQTIDAVEPLLNGQFGRGVAFDGERLVLGEPGAKVDGVTMGVVWTLTEGEDGSFTNAIKLTVPGAAVGDAWGTQVSLVGDRLVIAAPDRDVTVGAAVRTDAGAVASFDLSGEPAFEGILTAGAQAQSFARFGTHLRTTRGSAGDILAVVAPFASNGFLGFAGVVQCYRQDAGEWTPIGAVAGSKSSESLDQVALSNDLVAIGSPRWTNPPTAGRSSLYAIRENGLVLVADTKGSDESIISEDHIGGAVAISGDSAGGTWLYRAEESTLNVIHGEKLKAIRFGEVAGDSDRDGVLNGIEVTVNDEPDCNGNLVPDADELAGADCDGDGSLDACQSLPDSVSSLNTGWLGYTGWGPNQSFPDRTAVILGRVQVPEGSTGRLLSVGTRTSAIGNASAMVDAHLGVYRDPNGDGLPSDIELIDVAEANVSGNPEEIRFVLTEPVLLQAGESIFVALGLKLASQGSNVYMTSHPGPYQLGYSFGALLEDPDFASLPGEQFQELTTAPSSIGNVLVTAQFASAEDLDADGEIDACACPADIDGNGAIDAADLAILIGAWGTPQADLDGNGTTDAADLASLLGGWGPC